MAQPSESFLARQRNRAGISQAELAKRAGVGKNSVALAEQPEQPRGQLRTWLLLAKALNVDLLAVLQPEWLNEPLPEQRLRKGLPVDPPPPLS